MRLALVDRQWLLAGGQWGESAGEWCWDGLELAVGRRQCQQPITELAETLARRVELARQGGWEISSISCRFLYLTAQIPTAALAESVSGIIQLAPQLGINLVHLPCLVPNEDEGNGWQDCWSRWSEEARRVGVRLAWEWLGEPERCRECAEQFATGLAYDLGNRLALGGDVAGELRQWAERLVQVRLKDRVRGRPEQLRPLGEGCVRLTVLAHLLKRIAYQGWLVLDQPAVACDKSALQQLGQRLRQALADTLTPSQALAA